MSEISGISKISGVSDGGADFRKINRAKIKNLKEEGGTIGGIEDLFFDFCIGNFFIFYYF
jgi:hypothetical protein